METKDFVLKGEMMIAEDALLQLEIPREVFSVEIVQQAQVLKERFVTKIDAIAKFCVNDFNFRFFLGHLSEQDIAERLQSGQRMFYNGKEIYLYFDPKVINFGLLAIRINEEFDRFVLEDECCEAASCER